MDELLLILANYPKVNFALVVLGSLLSVATIVVGITPSKSDDEKLDALMKKPVYKKLYDILAKFSVISKK